MNRYDQQRLILRSRAASPFRRESGESGLGVSITAEHSPRLDGEHHDWFSPFETRPCGPLLRVRILGSL